MLGFYTIRGGENRKCCIGITIYELRFRIYYFFDFKNFLLSKFKANKSEIPNPNSKIPNRNS